MNAAREARLFGQRDEFLAAIATGDAHPQWPHSDCSQTAMNGMTFSKRNIGTATGVWVEMRERIVARRRPGLARLRRFAPG